MEAPTMSDYYPDVEKPQDAQMPRDGMKPTTVKELADAWSKALPDPMTFAYASKAYGQVVSFGWRVVDGICTGTCPTADVLVPDLYKAIKDAQKLKDGFDVYVKKGAGFIKWPASDPKYQRAKVIGLRVFHEAEKAITNVAKMSDLDLKVLIKKKEGDWSFWKGALMVGLGILTISTFSDLVKNLKGKD